MQDPWLEYPELVEGVEPLEKAARIGRFLVLNELGYFGTQTNLELAMGGYKGKFNAGVRKRFAGIYGNTEGCTAGDIEVAAELLGVMDDVYDFELRQEQLFDDGA